LPYLLIQKPPFYKSIVGFPPKMTYKLKYADAITLSSSGTAVTTYQFRANSVYQPDATNTGHQPLYFDQIMAIYDHYVVIGSKIKVTFNRNAAGANAARVCLYLNDDTTMVPASVVTATEQSTGKTSGMGIVDSIPQKLYLKYSSKEIFGPNPLANSQLKGSSSGNPTEIAVFSIMSQGYGTGTHNLDAFVEMEYIVVFFELKDMASS